MEREISASPGPEMERDDAPVFGVEAIRELDRRAIHTLGIPGTVLMENAGRGVADVAIDMLAGTDRSDGTVLVFTGPGNNAGDGFVAARYLANHGVDARLVCVTDPAGLSGNAEANWRICRNISLPTGRFEPGTDPRSMPAALVIDALLGTGSRPVESGPIRDAVETINAMSHAGTPVLSVDVPTGLDAETGVPSPSTVNAEATATFVGAKRGFLQMSAQAFLGEVIVIDIGVPPALVHALADHAAAPRVGRDVPEHGAEPGEDAPRRARPGPRPE